MKLWEISKLMNTNNLFKVDDDNMADTETGEVFNKEYLDQLPMKQEEKTKNVGLVIKNYTNNVDEITKEIERLSKMRSTYKNRIESLKSYILAFGCPVNDVAVTIKFNKGRDSIVVNDDADLSKWSPELVSCVYKPNKKQLLAAYKEGEELPAGVSVTKKPFVSVR